MTDTTAQAAAAGSDTTPADGADAQDQQPKTFDQAAVNQIVADRIARERQKYAGFDDLKTKAAEFDKIQEQNATELEKAVKKAADEARAEMSTKANTVLIRAEVRAAAAAVGFHDPIDAAVQLRDKFAEVKVTEDGDVDEAAVKALIDDLAKSKPYLVNTGAAKPAPIPGQGNHQKAPSLGREQGLAEAERRFGKKTPQS
jgi:hypothetical protein